MHGLDQSAIRGDERVVVHAQHAGIGLLVCHDVRIPGDDRADASFCEPFVHSLQRRRRPPGVIGERLIGGGAHEPVLGP